MPGEEDPVETAGLVARAEQVKRNREMIVRTFQPKPLTTPGLQSVALSRGGRLGAYLRVGNAGSRLEPDPPGADGLATAREFGR